MDNNHPSSKLKFGIRLLFIATIGVCFYIIFFFSDEIGTETQQKVDKLLSTENRAILFETQDYVVMKKIRRLNRIFTQGLFMDKTNSLIESGGLYGNSVLQKFNPNTPDEEKFRINIDSKYFAEGACMFNNHIYQLTWRERAM